LPAESASALPALTCPPLPFGACTPPDQCAQPSSPCRRLTIRNARSPFAPHRPLLLDSGRRIIVSGPLRSFWLAVP
jgi:hypothetical protein